MRKIWFWQAPLIVACGVFHQMFSPSQHIGASDRKGQPSGQKPAMTHSFLKIMSKSTLPFVRSQWHHQIRREKIVVLRCAEQVLECRQTLVSFCGIILYTADLDSSWGCLRRTRRRRRQNLIAAFHIRNAKSLDCIQKPRIISSLPPPVPR